MVLAIAPEVPPRRKSLRILPEPLLVFPDLVINYLKMLAGDS